MAVGPTIGEADDFVRLRTHGYKISRRWISHSPLVSLSLARIGQAVQKFIGEAPAKCGSPSVDQNVRDRIKIAIICFSNLDLTLHRHGNNRTRKEEVFASICNSPVSVWVQ